ncbi:MAG: phage holin family protein [Lachnospiraceae bacterium]|nr:phage holin family protein [Lachnospiraceae bacterium]
MEKTNVIKVATTSIAGGVSAIAAWLFARLGVLLYVLLVLAVAMIIDYITGMLASKTESIDHPEDPSYGWSSKKGAKGIIKKVGYLCIIAVAMMVDYIILNVAVELGFDITIKAFFGLMVTVWYLLNEALSIIENAGRMGAPIPEWLRQYIAVLKTKIESKGE